MSDTLARHVEVPLSSRLIATRTFLPYIDGMRGFFGLYIGLAHLWYRLAYLRPNVVVLPGHFIAIGHSAIAMFIVASGFVLGLPVARDGQTFRGGLRTFARRRALRILPAYYAALILAVPISWFCTANYRVPLTTTQFVASTILHAIMLHNISNSLLDSIDGPMWSVAIECDIYILFPLMMVPLARRFGFSVMTTCAFALGLIPVGIGILRQQGTDYRLAATCTWYIGLFALGYTAANLCVNKREDFQRRFEHWPWGRIAFGFATAFVLTIVLTPMKEIEENNGSRWFTDILIGFAIAAQFTADAQARARGTATRFERFFRAKPLLFVGTFSYSFYLVHLPFIDLALSYVRPNWPLPAVWAMALVAFLGAILTAYAFYLLIERRFMTAYRRRGDDTGLRSAQATEIPDTAFAPASARQPG